MKSFWFQFTVWMAVAASILAALLAASTNGLVAAQAGATDTPLANPGSAYITQTYTEPINVRTGPSTVDYPVIGQLPIGATAQALAASPSREWIEISYPAGPGGIGWIYAANVNLVGSLQIVEPPPTATPLVTPTFDPTLVAAFNIQPTVTRLPTFTPAPPLTVPVFSDPATSPAGFPMGPTIGVIALLGAAILGVASFTRR